MKISVVVVTWNGLHLLRPCVAALQAQNVSHELIVVDNGSTDGTTAWLRKENPAVRRIDLADNHGFAQGNNIGLRAATGDALVLINNDTVPPPHFLQAITQPLIDAEGTGVVAGVLTFAHRPDLIASAGIVAGRDGVHRDLLAMKPLSALPDEPREVFGASGGAVCFRRAALDDVGLFDPGYFNYLEDADLAWRLRLRGWKTMLAPQAALPHVYSATSGHASPAKQRLLARNRWRVLLRCWPADLLRRCALPLMRYDMLAFAYGLMTRQREIITGRLETLRWFPGLFTERRHILHRAVTSARELENWLEPAQSIGEIRRLGARLDQILGDRA